MKDLVPGGMKIDGVVAISGNSHSVDASKIQRFHVLVGYGRNVPWKTLRHLVLMAMALFLVGGVDLKCNAKSAICYLTDLYI